MSPASRMDLLLAKAKPISDGGSDCGIMFLRSEGQRNVQLQPENREYVRATAVLPSSSEQKEGQEVLQVPGLRFLCNPWRGSCALAAHGDPQGSRDSPAAHGGPHARAREESEESSH
ncbi:hypothetical protein WISP_40145 [Willisornis vidua]|uniref:Uncharacterized protein n=1 Tax=Willisornis vidua TaxID=1566151 RepID=A0ABQ9DLP8_9PASS|nr:hypothetical protein WISP_40145 [Willisornis vidua]